MLGAFIMLLPLLRRRRRWRAVAQGELRVTPPGAAVAGRAAAAGRAPPVPLQAAPWRPSEALLLHVGSQRGRARLGLAEREIPSAQGSCSAARC